MPTLSRRLCAVRASPKAANNDGQARGAYASCRLCAVRSFPKAANDDGQALAVPSSAADFAPCGASPKAADDDGQARGAYAQPPTLRRAELPPQAANNDGEFALARDFGLRRWESSNSAAAALQLSPAAGAPLIIRRDDSIATLL